MQTMLIMAGRQRSFDGHLKQTVTTGFKVASQFAL